MKAFTCGDVVPGCKVTFEAETEEEILAEACAHALADHGLVSIPASLVTSVRANNRNGMS